MRRHRRSPVRGRYAGALVAIGSLAAGGLALGAALESRQPEVQLAPPASAEAPLGPLSTPTEPLRDRSHAATPWLRPHHTWHPSPRHGHRTPHPSTTPRPPTPRVSVSPTWTPKPTLTPKPKPTVTLTPKPPAPTTVPPTVKPSLTEQSLTLLNAERAKVGSGPVARYVGMDATAQDWADHMASTRVMAHRPVLAPYHGEIVAAGYRTAAAVIDAWMHSPTHHDIMLDDAYDKVGIGHNNGYWIMVFS